MVSQERTAAPGPDRTPPASAGRTDRPPDPRGWCALRARVLRGWRPAAVVVFWLLLPVCVAGRITLFGGLSTGGFKSFTRNFELFVIAGALLGADGLRLRRSRLTAPLLCLLAAVWLSVEWNHGIRGEARLLAYMIGLYFAARALAEGPGGTGLLFHWLGLFAAGKVLGELVVNPDLLGFDPLLRTELRLMHPNTLGGALAVAMPVFVAALGGERRAAAAFYTAVSALGILLSFSRSALICATIGLAIAAVGRRARPWFVRAWWWVVAVVLTAAGVFVAHLSMGRSDADWQRLRILRAALTLFQDHWLLGIGFGIENLRRLFPARYIELYGESLFLYHSHNLYVDLLVGTGVLGAAAGLWLMLRLCTEVLEARRCATSRAERTETAAYLASVTVVLLLGLTDSLFYQSEIMVLLGILWALIETRLRALVPPGDGPPAPQAGPAAGLASPSA